MFILEIPHTTPPKFWEADEQKIIAIAADQAGRRGESIGPEWIEDEDGNFYQDREPTITEALEEIGRDLSGLYIFETLEAAQKWAATYQGHQCFAAQAIIQKWGE